MSSANSSQNAAFSETRNSISVLGRPIISPTSRQREANLFGLRGQNHYTQPMSGLDAGSIEPCSGRLDQQEDREGRSWEKGTCTDYGVRI